MKKALSLLLVLVLCLSLCACGEPQDADSNSISTGDTNGTESEALVLYDEEDGYSFVNQARFNEIVEEVELTTENWKNYIEVSSYTETIVHKDDFGEIVSTKTDTRYVLGAKGGKYYHFRGFVIELKDKSTGELIIYKGNTPYVTEDFRLEQYECTRIKGTLYLVDVPEEVIWKDTNGARHFTVRFCNKSYAPPLGCKLAGTDGRAIGGLIDIVLYN